MNNKSIIKKLYEYFDDREFCVSTDEKFEILWIHHGLSIVLIEKNAFNLSFEVNCDPMTAGIITQGLIEFSLKYKMDVNIFEPYAEVTDEEGIIQEMLFGDEALAYHLTGEIPIKEEEMSKEIKSKEGQEIMGVQQKVDTILDQINAKGMKSLNKDQKDFLVNYSKGKTEHKH